MTGVRKKGRLVAAGCGRGMPGLAGLAALTLFSACANHPCPTAEPLPWEQHYETVSLTAADAAASEPLDHRMAAVMSCGVNPCRDFYTYACGGWQEALEQEQAYRGVGLRELATLNQLWIRDIIKAAELSPGQSQDRRRIAEFSRACQDEGPRPDGEKLVRNIDGNQTLGENIADLGGMHASWDAYQAWLERHPRQAGPHVEGLTDSQLFFIAFGQTWCSQETGAQAAAAAEIDGHSSNQHRVNVVLANFPAFQDAFACEPGDAMVAENACAVW